MAVRSKGELLEAVREIIGDRNDDAVIALLEDIADSYPDEGIDWQKRLDDLDAEWRGKYIARFNEPVNMDNGGDHGATNKDVVDEGDNDVSEVDVSIDVDVEYDDLFEDDGEVNE